MSITANTILENALILIRTRLTYLFDPDAVVPSERVMIVDKLRLHDSAVPNLQIEPVSLQAIAEYSSMNIMAFEYKVHAVVRVELDMGNRSQKRMVGQVDLATDALPVGAFEWAIKVADRLIGYKPNTGTESQVFLRLENGTFDDGAGLASAAAHFRTMMRLMADG